MDKINNFYIIILDKLIIAKIVYYNVQYTW